MGLAKEPQNDLARIAPRNNNDLKKWSIIDLYENNFELPEVGIYDEPVRYYKANLTWATIIEGHLHWLAELAAWKDAEDSRYAGIQAILIFLQGVGMSPLADDISNGLYKAFNDLAKQIVSGRVTDIVVDEDGNVSAPASGDDGLPADDPATAIDETESSRAGGAIAVRHGINNLLFDVHTLYGTDATEDTTLSDALFLISSEYKVDLNLLTTAMTEYWADRAAGKVQLTSIDTLLLDSALYCRGISKSTINAVIAGITAFSIEARQNGVALVNALTDEQLSDWQKAGERVPSTDYLDYYCVPIPTEQIVINWDAANNPLNGTQKINHRYLVETDGVLIDPDGDIQDTWYYVPVGGNPVANLAGFNIYTSGAATDPTLTEVPYRSDHKYVWTYDRTTTSALTEVEAVRDGLMAATSTGQLTVKITDLGEII